MRSIFSMIKDSYEENPDKMYVSFKDEDWSYKDIYNKILKFAKVLEDNGVKHQDRVVFFMNNSIEYIVSFFATLLLGGIVVPVNTNASKETLEYIVEQTAPKCIISIATCYKKISKCCQRQKVLLADSNSGSQGDKIAFETVLNDNYKELPAMIIFTSGTTAKPKGVTLTHRNLIVNTESILGYLKLTNEDSILVTIPFSYSYGNSLLLTHTKAGASMYIENMVLYPPKVVEAIRTKEVTGFSTVGSYLNILLKLGNVSKTDIEHLRYMTFAGESVNYDDIYRVKKMCPNILLYVMYGQTEAGARLSYLDPDLIFVKKGSIGKGIPGVDIKVVDEKSRNVKPGEIGEIVARGFNIMRGYWNSKGATDEIIKNGWLFTGDLATVDEEGYIYIKGRKKDIIKYMGHRISPMEIEKVLNEFENIIESAVVEKNIDGRNFIHAYVVARNKIKLDELSNHIRMNLPSIKRPHNIELVEEIPRTANGKIKRSALRDREECFLNRAN